VTEWRVTQRSDTRTCVTLLPRTRLAHQLRVHAAHPLGLGVPIVGDALYGRDDTRLMLHAEALTLVHPRTGERLEFESRPPF
jgi:tRNA pseudouridine32 synthase/23S rRNA pseudouridine746 synthase